MSEVDDKIIKESMQAGIAYMLRKRGPEGARKFMDVVTHLTEKLDEMSEDGKFDFEISIALIGLLDGIESTTDENGKRVIKEWHKRAATGGRSWETN